MIIYTDSEVGVQIIRNINQNIIQNFGEFIQKTGPKKAVFHAPFPRHLDFAHLSECFNKIYDGCDQIILLVSELHDVTVDFIEKHDKEKIVYFLNGDLNLKLKWAKAYHWNNWFETTSTFYNNNLNLLNTLSPYTVKPKYFDVLLGQERPHRQEIFSYINNNDLSDKTITTYLLGIQQSLQSRTSNEWIWEQEGLEIPDWSIRHTITKVKYHKQLISLSQIIPFSVYNKTAYTLVAETWGNDNRFTFNTEKIVKPILAERLFLVASNQFYLRNLRRMGFRTFDNIIDESYDLEPDYKKRCSMLCDQLKYLTTLPQEDILARCRPITEHNKKIMLETDWFGDFSRELQAVLLDHVRQN